MVALYESMEDLEPYHQPLLHGAGCVYILCICKVCYGFNDTNIEIRMAPLTSHVYKI